MKPVYSSPPGEDRYREIADLSIRCAMWHALQRGQTEIHKLRARSVTRMHACACARDESRWRNAKIIFSHTIIFPHAPSGKSRPRYAWKINRRLTVHTALSIIVVWLYREARWENSRYSLRVSLVHFFFSAHSFFFFFFFLSAIGKWMLAMRATLIRWLINRESRLMSSLFSFAVSSVATTTKRSESRGFSSLAFALFFSFYTEIHNYRSTVIRELRESHWGDGAYASDLGYFAALLFCDFRDDSISRVHERRCE